MATAPKPTSTTMTTDEFVAWYETQPGRFELHNGEVFAMAPEPTGQLKAKMRAYTALTSAIERGGCRPSCTI